VANELTAPEIGAAGQPRVIELGPVIDLGSDFQPVETKAQIRRRNRRGGRPLAVAAAALLTLIGVAAAAPRPAGALVRAAHLDVFPGATMMVVGDTAYVADLRGSTKEMQAFRLDNGDRIWSTTLHTQADNNAMYRVGSTIVVAYTANSPLDVLTDGVDMRTGRLLWQSAASLVDIVGGRVLLSAPSTPQADVLERVDPVTGTPLWRQPVGHECVSDLADTYVELCPATDDLRVIDLDTGGVRASRKVDVALPADDAPPDAHISLSQTAGVIIAGYPTPGTPVIGGFTANDLTPLWSRPFFPDAMVNDCGAVFCMYDNSIATGVDPRTGDTMPFPGYDRVRERGLLSPDIGGGQVMLNTRHALIPRGARPDHDGNYPGATALVAVPDSAPVRVPSSADLDTFIAAVDPVTGRMTILDRLHGVGVQSCAAVGAYLVCSEPGARLQFWRLEV
jgi:hypothetical protein